jgi:hypothetical protein
LEAIVRSTEWLMGALQAAREVDAPDWLIGAGAARTVVWDREHGFAQPTPLADIDLVFLDPCDLSPGRERAIEARLRHGSTGAPWQTTNQASVHLWYERKFGRVVEPLTSSEDAVATWPETAASVGLRLAHDDGLTIVAPFGLDDLLGLVLRHNPCRATAEEYDRRVRSKRITERWPRVTVLPGPGSAPARGLDEQSEVMVEPRDRASRSRRRSHRRSVRPPSPRPPRRPGG